MAEDHKILIASALVKTSGNVVPLRIMNVSTEPQVLRKGTDATVLDQVDNVMMLGNR